MTLSSMNRVPPSVLSVDDKAPLIALKKGT